MTESVIDPDLSVNEGPAGSPEQGRQRVWSDRRSRWDVPAAVATFAVGLIAAAVAVHVAGRNPLTLGGAVLPIAAGAVVAVALLALLLRVGASGLVVSVVAGAYAAWIAFVMLTALHGTPFGYDGLNGDEARLVAQATKSMSAWGAVDGFVRGLPTEYPPLFPWLVGHWATLVGRPAWRVIGDAQVFGMSLSLLFGYLLWRRLVDSRLALLITVLTPLAFVGEHAGDAAKVFEYAVLLVITPWALATFAGRPRERGGLHWLPAGIIGGLIVLTYSGFLIFAIPGILAMVGLAVYRTRPALPYLRHLAGVVVTAFVVASWYVVPFVTYSLAHGGNRLSDLYPSYMLVSSPLALSFLDPTPLGVVELVGLVGLVWYRTRRWWAQPLLLLFAGGYLYRLAFMLMTSYNNHTGYLQYTERFTGALLVAAGVLTGATVAESLAARFPQTLPRLRECGVLLAVVLVAWASWQMWTELMPGPLGVVDARDNGGPAHVGTPNYAAAAHAQTLPDGSLPKIALPGARPSDFEPVRVQQAITSVLGPDARPTLLTNKDVIFDFYPYYAYLPYSRLAANTLQRWDDRLRSIQDLSTTTDAATFALRSAHLPFGRIDVFVLQAQPDGWVWQGRAVQVGGKPTPARVVFDPQVFSRSLWQVFQLPSGYVVAVRRPGAS